MKRVVAVIGVFVVSLAPAAPVGGAPASFIAYGADASGTAVHLVGITNSLSNFRNGFLDNYFPLASTHLDASPATTATSTVADTGPGGGFADFEVNGKLPQTQYALAGHPGVPSASLSEQGAIVTAAATESSADARAAVASTTSGGPTAVTAPGAAADIEGDEGQSHVRYDAAAGTVTAASAGTFTHLSLGGGLVTIDGLTVSAAVTATATATTPTYSVNAAGVKVAGQAVSVTDKGVVPVGASAPTAAIDQVLSQAGITLTTTAPVITRNGGSVTVDVTGITVTFTAPNPNPSIPTLVSKLILGEASAFAFATPAPPAPAPTSVPPASIPTAVTAPVAAPAVLDVPPPVVVSTPPPSPVASPPVAAPTALAAPSGLRLVTTQRRPAMLLWVYLAWQIIIIGNAGAIVWWRRRAAA